MASCLERNIGKHMKGVVGSGKAANAQAFFYGLSLFGMPDITVNLNSTL